MKYIFKKIILFLFLLVCIFETNAYAVKNKNINFQSMTIDDGLAQSLVEYIYQDSFGYIWIGTNDGLNRFDGKEFKLYKNIRNDENTISNNRISCILEYDAQNIWIGTYGGLNKMNLTTGEIKRYLVSDDDKRFSNTVVDEIFIDSKKRLWVCTINGLNLYDNKTDSFIQVAQDYLGNKRLQDIVEDSQGNLWIATIDGLYKYNHDKNYIEEFHYDKNNKNTISDSNVFTLYYKDSKLYIGTKNGGLNIMNLKDNTIKVYTHNSNDSSSIPSNYIRDILIAADGTIWLGTDQGLATFDEKDEKSYTYLKSVDKFSICDNNIVNLYEDRQGTIWVGTFNGLSKFSNNKYFTVYRNDAMNENSLSNSSVCGIYEDNEGYLWVGTFNSGLNRIDKKDNTVTRFINSDKENSISSNSIKTITGIDNEIWIATDNGLNMYDKNTGEFTVYKKNDSENSIINDDIRSLFIDKSGVLWIGTKGGICTFDRKNKFTNYSDLFEVNNIYEKLINSIYEDSEGIIWIGLGNDGGLVKYNKATGEVKNYLSDEKNIKTLSFNTIRSINGDSKDNIWIGTQNGLNKFNKKTEEFTTYTYNDGLSNDFIYGVLVDKSDNIWLSTNYGISMYDQDKEKFIRYYESDGIASNESNGFSYHQSKNGKMYFGGINGVTEFNPVDIKAKITTSNILIESIKTNNSVNLKIQENIVLDYNSRDLYIKFFIPEYNNINQIQYTYRLKGLEDEWTFSGNENYARYSNLPPGKYQMQIAGRNHNGIWSEVSNINIKVKNSIWKTPLASIIYMVIILIVIYLVYNQVKILDRLVAQRTIELDNKLKENNILYEQLIKSEKYKNNYFINLSHELRTPLNVILSIEQLIRSLNRDKDKLTEERLEGYMDTLKNNSNRLLNLINNIIDTSKIESGSYRIDKETVNIVSLVEDTTLAMVQLAEIKGLELIVDPEIEELFIKCDKLDIERCIINLIGNAIKFTEAGGNIIVSISRVGENVRISVKDSGIGIDPKYHESIFDRFGQVYNQVSEEFGGSGLGLTLTRNLIALHKGEISVVSEKGQGSEFIILLPIE